MIARILTAMALVALAVTAGHAQAPADNSAHKKAMERLQWLTGRWEGSATMILGPNQRSKGHAVETVQTRLDGTVLLIEGLGKARIADRDVTVHNALGVISYEPSSRRFRMRAYKSDGHVVDADVEVGDRRLVWGMKTSAGEFRFTIKLNEAGQWHETGERSVDGKTWQVYMEMTLDRKPDQP